MKNYLSYGGGVNSVAMHILMIRECVDFDAIFVDHGTDWPETYEYLLIFQGWLSGNGHKPIIVLRPNVEGMGNNLYDYYEKYRMVPSTRYRICTDKFKVTPIHKFVEKPCFMMIGFAADESKRARLSGKTGIENRFPLIEWEIDRAGCKKIIQEAGLPVPMKSGCFICPFQRNEQWRELRKKHPNLFCKAQKLEERNMKYRRSIGKPVFTLRNNKKTLGTIIDEMQNPLFKEDIYPPCECQL